jgi:tetratricopeptide (TPR) repeat protein
VRAFEAAVSADPASADGWYWLAVTRDNRGDELNAIPAYERAIRLGLDQQRLGRAWTWLASSLSKTGRPADALACLAHAAAMGGYRPHTEYARVRHDVQRRAERAMGRRPKSRRLRPSTRQSRSV